MLMAVEILMPELGESVHEGTVSRWLKKEGEFVKEDEPVVEIMTDKVNTELPSPASGILTKILIQEGENVEVFKAMGIIEAAGSATDAPKLAEAKAPDAPKTAELATPTPTPAPAQPVESDGHKWYTPVVKAIAKDKGLTDAQLASIAGSGEDGRVTKKDVEAYLASGPSKPAATPAVTPVTVSSTTAQRAGGTPRWAAAAR